MLGRHNLDVGATQPRMGRHDSGRQGDGAKQPDTVSHNGVLLCCWCSNDSRFVSKGQGISFHRFPTEDSLLIEWLAKISRVGLEVTKDTRLCSNHFESDCFERDLRAELLGSKGKRTLKPDAVPTIFDHRPRKKPRLSTEKRLQEKAKREVRIIKF